MELWKSFIGTTDHPHWADILEQQLGRAVDRANWCRPVAWPTRPAPPGWTSCPGWRTVGRRAGRGGGPPGRGLVVAGGLGGRPPAASAGWSTASRAVCTGDEVLHTKPDPAAVPPGLFPAGVDPARAVAVEDSVNGVPGRQGGRHGWRVAVPRLPARRRAWTSPPPMPWWRPGCAEREPVGVGAGGRTRRIGSVTFPQQRLRRLRRTPGPAPAGGRDPPGGRRPGRPAVRAGGHRRPAARSRRCPAWCSTPARRCGGRSPNWPTWASPPSSCSGSPRTKDAVGLGRLGPRRHRAGGAARAARRPRRPASCSWPTCASTSTPTTATAACSPPTARSTTTPRSSATPRWRWPRPRPASTSCAPSGMMDGQVLAIRDALDDDGFERGRDPGLRRQVRLRACTARSATRSTSRSPTAATARPTSRTGATPASRWRRSAPTSPRAPTW